MAAERVAADVANADVRHAVDVAVGVLIDAEGRFLLTSRPAGKVYAGYWEFPGGKLEPGESIELALRRELHEELGITIGPVQPWQVELMDYPHARVRLHFCKVFAWQGEFEMREGQQMAWQTLPVQVQPVLPGTVPVLAWFAAERGFVGQTHAPPPQFGGSTEPDAAPTLDAMSWLEHVKWGRDGLIPVIAQEAGSGDVLMFAWMNREALAATKTRGQAVYWSRSRAKLWHKGEHSGHFQQVHEIRMDCDSDVLLLKVTQLGHEPGSVGIACHTGRHSCFFKKLDHGQWKSVEPVLADPEDIYK